MPDFTDEPAPGVDANVESSETELPDEQNDEEFGAPTDRGVCPVVGIGASAGGLDAFTQMLKHLPANTGMAYVLIPHLDPHHESMLVGLLAQHTSMPVTQAMQGTKVEPDRVYIIPPNTQMAIRHGVLELTPRNEDRARNLPIDFFLSSLARERSSRSIGIILSGAASDGTLGLEAIKGAGGITFAQDDTARFDGMPRSAIATGVVDFVLPPEGIARELASIAEHSYFGLRIAGPMVEDGPTLEKILSLLQSRTGVNFTHYKKPTVRRRLARRMALNHLEKQAAYLKLLEERPAEVDALFDDLLITVTDFFRDADTFAALTEKAFPAMLKDRSGEDPIRVWVPGCSTGKEVYSLAIALTEYFEATQKTYPIQIFGTDVSEQSIQTARIGKYPESISVSVSPLRLKRFFLKVEGGYQITRAIRDVCIFSRQDITKDPPLSKMDLISCRNLLIYLGSILQRRVLSIFVYALQPTGCLLLGNSESLGGLADYFMVLDGKHKIYRRNPELGSPPFELPLRLTSAEYAGQATVAKVDDATLLDRQADRMLLDEYAPAGFLINERYDVVKFRGDVGPYLSPPPGDPELDIFKLVREDVALILRSMLEEARRTKSMVRRDKIQVHRNDGFREISLVLRPLAGLAGERHYLVLLEETSQQGRAANANSSGGTGGEEHQEKLALELSATRAYMQRLIEELRSANEEAQSSNEELQSTNEELQTAKEELQSSNEELTTTNEEMQSRNSELSQLNNDLVNILSSMNMPIVMLTNDLRIRRFTPIAEEVLNVIPTDIGRPISDLKPRIDVPDLEDLLFRVIRTGEPLERDVEHQNGRWYSLRIQPYRTSVGRVDGAVLHLMDIDQLKLAMKEVRHGRNYAEAIIETIREPLLVLDQSLCIQTANPAFFDIFKTSSEATIGRSFYELDRGQWHLPIVSSLLGSLSQEGNGVIQEIELEHEFARIGWKTFQLNARYLRRSQESNLILLVIEDISDRKKAAEAKYRRLFETAKDGILIINGESGEITDVNPFLSELLGLGRAELVGKRFWEIDPFRHLPSAEQVLDRLQKEPLLRFPDFSIRGPRNQEIVVEVVANRYEEGPKHVAQFNIRDITERKQFDQHFQETARLETLGILAGGIAHDFNNLLAGILGNAGLALSDAPAGTPYESALRDVVHASQRAAELTRQMLAYAGKGRLNVRALDFSVLVREISDLMQSSISKSVELKLDLAKDLPAIEADSGQMQQVVMNLVINGAESIGERRKGEVCVITREEVLSAENLRTIYGTADIKPGSFVVLEVTDNGCGMDEAIRQRIFDPFFTTKFTGRGLGLAAVQGIVRGHHGAISVSSAPREGSTFLVALPAAHERRTSPREPTQPLDLRGSGLVLVVDDEPIVLTTTRAILERHGYQVLTAANGELAVDAVRENRDKLALVILDLTMPVMGGEEALGRIKQIAPQLPVILSSGYDAAEAVRQFGENSLAGFIHKPSTVVKLLEAVQRALHPPA
ncbi:MAG TPA: chemotaxis protein CheB [Acidobacteriaceae bacterium]|nr:chemotaxis protein CheB [Acidobacteriaceae bacterium]